MLRISLGLMAPVTVLAMAAGATAAYAVEFAKSDEDRQMLTLFFGQLALGRALFAPPEVPADRARALSDAATMKDGDFQAEANKLRLETRWFGPDKMREVTSQMAATPAAVREKARQFSVFKKE